VTPLLTVVKLVRAYVTLVGLPRTLAAHRLHVEVSTEQSAVLSYS